MAKKHTYSYMPTDECKKHMEWGYDAPYFDSTQTNIHFRNQYGRIFVLIDRKKLIRNTVLIAVAAYIFGVVMS